MPESGPYGSVRGALSNERPYRDYGRLEAEKIRAGLLVAGSRRSRASPEWLRLVSSMSPSLAAPRGCLSDETT